ncbi:MAG TPA: alpha/beta hydrolase [Acidimicrobiales bacterium]|nr:alpha/beta hydrolase [Acidimicrobiales bacterium]
MVDSHVTVLRDGRDLAWLEVGDPAGVPVFVFHGTPGSRLLVTTSDEVGRSAGARLICPDRPGYGLSSFQPGRRLVDWPGDVAALADHLGIDRFAVMGLSGGGPHSAVCAALLHDRVSTAAIVSGVGPLSDPNAMEGMMRFNRLLTGLSRRRSPLVRLVLGPQTAIARRWPQQGMDFFMKQLPAPDAAVLSRPEVRALFVDEATKTPRTAARAAAQDFELFSQDWGFALRDISVPVHLWQGDADVNVPASHARIQHEAIPGSVLHECPGEGHFLAFDHLGEILEILVANAG